MKPVRLIPLLGAAALAACVAETPRPPPPQPRPVRRPVEMPRPAPQPPQPEWQDLPLTLGNWSYFEGQRGSDARFGLDGSAPALIVRCDKARGEIILSRQGLTTGNTMSVRTSFGARNLPLSIEEGATYVSAAMPATDLFLDNLAFSRGRFTVDVPGIATLVIPSWSEPARVIEDCRG